MAGERIIIPQSIRNAAEKTFIRAETVIFKPEPFVPLNPPLTREQSLQRETWMMDFANRREDDKGLAWSVPSEGKHYRYMWKWDSLKGAVINARRDKPDQARAELLKLEEYRDPKTGFVSNKIFGTERHKTWRDYPEAWNFNNNKIGSSYSQPPIEAWSTIETYDSFMRQNREEEALQFLEEIYGTAEPENYTGLQGEYSYFMNHRKNSLSDPLIGIVHRNETGRDSDEANNEDAEKAPGWLGMQKRGYELGKLGKDPNKERIDWIPEQIRQKYWVNDVMFNAMYASNLRTVGKIAGILAEKTADPQKKKQYKKDVEKYRTQADRVEERILEAMWNEEEGFFYNLDKNGNQIPVDSITGLFPLLLDKIKPEQTTALLDKLEDPEWFNTPYPIPTHATRSKFYDPEPRPLKEKFTPPWSGPVWISTNHQIVEEGLIKQAERFLKSDNPEEQELGKRCLQNAERIAKKTEELLAINPKVMECYSPLSGKGIRVETFMWSNLGNHFEKFYAAKKRLSYS
jgi:hypothetical protein